MVGISPDTNWRWYLAAALESLGPMPRGRYVPDPDAAEESFSGQRFLDVEHIVALINRGQPGQPSDNPKDRDPRIGLSRMSRQYCAVLTCVALTGLANGVGIDLSPGRCRVLFRDDLPGRLALDAGYHADAVLRCAERPTAWPVTGPEVGTVEQLREHVWTNLYARNLSRLFALAVERVNIPARLLWSNAAEWIGIVMDGAIEYLEPRLGGPVVAECRALLDAESLPGLPGIPNPLRGLMEWVPFDDRPPRHGIQTRHLCCLVYLHTDRQGRLCQNCPLLPLPDRAALLRERRGVGMTKRGGPAELRCTEVGLRRRRLALRDR